MPFIEISNFTPQKGPHAVRLPALLLLLALGGALTHSGRAAEARVAVARSAAETPALRGAHLVRRLPPTQTISLALTLPLRNQGRLDTLLHRLYTPGDALRGKFLTPAQFDAQFAPTSQDYAAVAAYARAQGLKVTAMYAGRTVLKVSGPASVVETALGVHMSEYRLRDGRVVSANSAAPRLPQAIAARLSGIAGLSSLGRMRPNFHPVRPARAGMIPHAPLPGSGGNGSGPNGGLSPNDIKYAYSLDSITPLYGATATTTTTGTTTATPLDGTGQKIGLFELDGYDPKDIALYVNQFGLPTVLTATTTTPSVLQNVLIGPYKGAVLTADGQREVTLDIDMALALAPNVAGLYVYEADGATDTTAALDIFMRMAGATDPVTSLPLLNVISCSWGVPELEEDPATRNGENTLFQKMAAQGQSLFCASGDQGAYDNYTATTAATYTLSVDNPASQPFATGVGGTRLMYNKPVPVSATVLTAKPGTYVSESAWDTSGPTSLNGPEGGGGGISEVWAKPDYQQGFGASPENRDVPDVSLDADPDTGYDIYVAGKVETDGGTSAASPLWAGFTALIDQQRVLNGLTGLGFANPYLYAIGGGTKYTTDFHDVQSGTNLYFQAGTGYDDATGLGSFIGSALLADLSFNPDQGTATGTLTGTVADVSGAAIVGATITVTSTATGSIKGTTVTDGSGNYTLTVPAGLSLNITVDPSTAPASAVTTTTTNYSGATIANVTVAASGSLVENFALTPAFEFAAGLQMISAPFDYTASGADFAALFGLTPPLRSPTARLIQWQPGLGAYVFYPTAPADTLRPGQAYWIKFPAATYIRLGGTAVPTTQAFQITLQDGWNQIGDPFQSAAPLSGITADLPTGGSSAPIATSTLVQPTLYHYNMTTGAYDALDPTTASLQPYDGVWIYARTTVVLSIPPEGPPSVPGVPGIPLVPSP